jgi:DNA modification methylase
MQTKVIKGDCLEVLKSLEDNSVDSLVTDPPAGISFMGKEWDDNKGGRLQWIKWMSQVMEECMRVMKPGAHGLVWAIPRTSHWTATALEDAGFEIRDVVTHLFGSGFPKSLDVSKAIDKAAGAKREVVGFDKTCRLACNKNLNDDGWDKIGNQGAPITKPKTDSAKQWSGWGTALKPASEHWILIRKPLSEKTVASNVERWGCGAINIDASRIDAQDADKLAKNWDRSAPAGFGNGLYEGKKQVDGFKGNAPSGRFPANLVLSHSINCTEEACDMFTCPVSQLDEQSGKLDSGGPSRNTTKYKDRYHDKADKQGLNTHGKYSKKELIGYSDSGGASRFFYVAKVSSKERNAGAENKHPTVKPIKLMSYLIRMITPPNGLVLDPFTGSGSTGVAAVKEGFRFLGIEREAEYHEIAKKRIKHAANSDISAIGGA